MQIETGYCDTIHDYDHELSYRDTLEDLLSLLPESIGTRLKQELVQLDERFVHSTTQVEKPVLPGDHPQFWWYRVPARLCPELDESDLSKWQEFYPSAHA